MFLSLVAHSDTRGHLSLVLETHGPSQGHSGRAGRRVQRAVAGARGHVREARCVGPRERLRQAFCLQLRSDRRKACGVPPLCLVGVGTVCWVFEQDCLKKYSENGRVHVLAARCPCVAPPAPRRGRSRRAARLPVQQERAVCRRMHGDSWGWLVCRYVGLMSAGWLHHGPLRR